MAADVPAVWFFDRDLIEMALVNAIQNSLAYARSIIRIEASMVDGCLALSVRDDSDGYPEHILTSVATNTPYRATGTGLGLQFARLIVQTHENRGRLGELRLYNESGAVFSLLLP
jgi:K+-sensing histidine kinase KdpD